MNRSLLRVSMISLISILSVVAFAEGKGKKGGKTGESAPQAKTEATGSSNAAISQTNRTATNQEAANASGKGEKSVGATAKKKGDSAGATTERLSGAIEALDVPGRKITLGGKTLAIGPKCKIYTLEADGNAYLSDLDKGIEVKVTFSIIDGVATATTIATKEAAAGAAAGMTLGSKEDNSAKPRGKKK